MGITKVPYIAKGLISSTYKNILTVLTDKKQEPFDDNLLLMVLYSYYHHNCNFQKYYSGYIFWCEKFEQILVQ